MPSTRTEMRPVKYHYADSFWCTYVISVAAASVAETVTYPLGNLKFNLFYPNKEVNKLSI